MTRPRRRQAPPGSPGLPAANRMTTAEAMALDIGDHDSLLANVMRTLAACGYLCHAEPKALAVDRGGRQAWRTPTMGPKGWPDILAIRAEDGRIVVAEVKTGSGRLSPAQRAWFLAWEAVARLNPRVTVAEVRPSTVQAFYDIVLPLYGEVRP